MQRQRPRAGRPRRSRSLANSDPNPHPHPNPHLDPNPNPDLAQRGLVDREVGRAQGDDAGHGARLVERAEHEGVERLEDDHLVARVQEGEEDGRERLQPTRA